jgi:fumarate hydratase class I
MPTFEIKAPVGANQIVMRRQIREAIAEATRRGKLRPNSVDSITGVNSGDNLGPGTPIIHFDQWERDEIEIRLILKGGGCENTNAQHCAGGAPAFGLRDRRGRGQCLPRCGAQGKAAAWRRRSSPATANFRLREEQLFRRLTRIDRGWPKSGVDHGDREHARDRPDGIWRQGLLTAAIWRAQSAAG